MVEQTQSNDAVKNRPEPTEAETWRGRWGAGRLSELQITVTGHGGGGIHLDVHTLTADVVPLVVDRTKTEITVERWRGLVYDR
jgi:hypothetical protein